MWKSALMYVSYMWDGTSVRVGVGVVTTCCSWGSVLDSQKGSKRNIQKRHERGKWEEISLVAIALSLKYVLQLTHQLMSNTSSSWISLSSVWSRWYAVNHGASHANSIEQIHAKRHIQHQAWAWRLLLWEQSSKKTNWKVNLTLH